MVLRCVSERRLGESGYPDVIRAGVPRQDDSLSAAVRPRLSQARRLSTRRSGTLSPKFGGHLSGWNC